VTQTMDNTLLAAFFDRCITTPKDPREAIDPLANQRVTTTAAISEIVIKPSCQGFAVASLVCSIARLDGLRIRLG
jgi:hypothetical protein